MALLTAEKKAPRTTQGQVPQIRPIRRIPVSRLYGSDRGAWPAVLQSITTQRPTVMENVSVY